MGFEESYFEGEVREDFYIEPMMKRAWAASLKVLKEIDRICEKYGITYFADWGTLLGAVRHQGFIPWDDDLDIAMKRDDYEHFLRIVSSEIPAEWDVRTVTKYTEWNRLLIRINNTKEIPLTGERLEEFYHFPYMAGVDIFPIDYLPNDKAEEEVQTTLFGAVYGLALAWDKGEPNENMDNLHGIEKCCNIKFNSEIPYKHQLWTLANQIAAMYGDTKEGAKELTQMYQLAENPQFKLPVSCYESVVRVPFENTTIPIPVGYEQILTLYYGDYRKPIRGTADHEYPYYKGQQKELFDFYEKNRVEIPAWLMEILSENSEER